MPPCRQGDWEGLDKLCTDDFADGCKICFSCAVMKT